MNGWMNGWMDGLTKQTILLHSSLSGELYCGRISFWPYHDTSICHIFLSSKAVHTCQKSHWRNPRACQQLSLTRSRPPRELEYSQLHNKLFTSVLRIQKRARTNKPRWAPASEEKGENFQGFVFHLSAWNERKRNATDCRNTPFPN